MRNQPSNFNLATGGTEGGRMGWLARCVAAGVMHGQIKLPHVTLCDLQPLRYSGTLTRLPPQCKCRAKQQTHAHCSPRSAKRRVLLSQPRPLRVSASNVYPTLMGRSRLMFVCQIPSVSAACTPCHIHPTTFDILGRCYFTPRCRSLSPLLIYVVRPPFIQSYMSTRRRH